MQWTGFCRKSVRVAACETLEFSVERGQPWPKRPFQKNAQNYSGVRVTVVWVIATYLYIQVCPHKLDFRYTGDQDRLDTFTASTTDCCFCLPCTGNSGDSIFLTRDNECPNSDVSCACKTISSIHKDKSADTKTLCTPIYPVIGKAQWFHVIWYISWVTPEII